MKEDAHALPRFSYHQVESYFGPTLPSFHSNVLGENKLTSTFPRSFLNSFLTFFPKTKSTCSIIFIFGNCYTLSISEIRSHSTLIHKNYESYRTRIHALLISLFSNSRKHYGHLLETPKSNPIYILKNGTKLQYHQSINQVTKKVQIHVTRVYQSMTMQ